MTKIDIFSGFLGAGKTTLIKKLLTEAYTGEKLVLIENEFGQIGIDGGFLKEAGITVNEMNSGCICCSLVGDFAQALQQVLATYHPDRILIEPSGVGKLSDVVKAIEPILCESVALNACVAVADVTKCKLYLKNFGEFYKNQILSADTIIFSRTSTATEEKVEQALALLRELNPNASYITTPWDQLDGVKLLQTIEQKNHAQDIFARWTEEIVCPICGEHHHHHEEGEHCDCHEHHHHHHEAGEHCDCHEHHHHHHEHHHHADEIFESLGWETAHRYTEESLHLALQSLEEENTYGQVLRAKGILCAQDGRWLHFDYVPGESQIRYGTAEVIGRLCVIGADLKEEKLKALFAV